MYYLFIVVLCYIVVMWCMCEWCSVFVFVLIVIIVFVLMLVCVVNVDELVEILFWLCDWVGMIGNWYVEVLLLCVGDMVLGWYCYVLCMFDKCYWFVLKGMFDVYGVMLLEWDSGVKVDVDCVMGKWCVVFFDDVVIGIWIVLDGKCIFFVLFV